jgi:hypothetical protein
MRGRRPLNFVFTRVVNDCVTVLEAKQLSARMEASLGSRFVPILKLKHEQSRIPENYLSATS